MILDINLVLAPAAHVLDTDLKINTQDKMENKTLTFINQVFSVSCSERETMVLEGMS